MPNYWTRISSSPAVQRREQVKQACAGHGAQLLGNELSYDADGNCWALIHLRDAAAADALFSDPDLAAHEARGHVNAEEKDAGKSPPADWRKD